MEDADAPFVLYVGEGGRIGLPRHRYTTTIERAGYALAAGSALGGLATMLLMRLGGEVQPLQLASGLAIGASLSAFAIVALASPLWLLLHRAGCRHPALAALLGALIALLVFAGAQSWGFGLVGMPAMDARTQLFRWASVLATSAVLALLAAAIGLAMWRIAYRRVPGL